MKLEILETQPTGEIAVNNRARRFKTLVALGRMRDSVKALTSHGVANASGPTIEILKSKHPFSPKPTFRAECKAASIVTPEIVRRAIDSFPNGSAGGPSGFRPDHLKECLKTALQSENDSLLDTITKFINILLEGQAPKEVAKELAGANLIPIMKKDSGIRPVAVGDIFRRIAIKSGSMVSKDKLISHLEPHQLGIGIQHASEAIIHSTARMVELYGHDNQFALMKVDFENAFNNINRDILLERFSSVVPGLYNWFEYCYSDTPFLRVGDEIINSSAGVQQGDP